MNGNSCEHHPYSIYEDAYSVYLRASRTTMRRRLMGHVGAVALIRKLGSGEEKTGSEVEQQRRPHRPYVSPLPTLPRRQRRCFRLLHSTPDACFATSEMNQANLYKTKKKKSNSNQSKSIKVIQILFYPKFESNYLENTPIPVKVKQPYC